MLFQAGQGHIVKTDFGQRCGVAFAAPGVGIDPLDQLAHRVLSVANHQRRLAPGSGHQLVAHHQQTVIAAGQKALDHDLVAELGGVVKSRFDVLSAADVDRDPLALVAVAGLDHHWGANRLGRRPSIWGIFHRATLGHGHASGIEQFFGQVFVLRNGFCNGAAQIGFGGLDAALLAAPTKLHQAAFGQAAVGYAAHQCGIHDGAGGGAQADVFVQGRQLTQRRIDVKGRVVPSGLAQLLGQFKGQPAHFFFGVLHHHLVQPCLGCQGSAAESDRTTGFDLHVQGGIFDGMGHAQHSALLGGAQLAQPGKQVAQALLKIGGMAQIAFRAMALDHGFNGGVACPQVGAAQGADA